MRQRYEIREAVRGVHGVRLGVVVEYDYEPGEYTPKDPVEAKVLRHLVATGHASLVTAKPKKKEA